MSLLVNIPRGGIFPAGNYLPRSEDPSAAAGSREVGDRPTDFRYLVAIPKSDGTECLHGCKSSIIGGGEKDAGSYSLEEFCPGTF